MQEKIHIEKNTVQETLIIPLYARKLCTEIFPEIFKDTLCVKLIERLDYDFSSIEEKSKSAMQRFGALEVAMRQTDLATEVKSYLKAHPKAAVVNLGCGLDQTAENCDNGTCLIYNLDFPDVITIRNELLPATGRITNIGVDLNDTSWFEKIDSSDGVVFFAAGVFYYFTKEKVKKLFCAMNEKFKGGMLVFDSAGKSAVKLMIKTWIKQAEIKNVDAYFSVDDIQKDILSWSNGFNASSKGYMLGYQKPKGKNVSGLFKLLSKIGDGMMKMKIVKIDFQSES